MLKTKHYEIDNKKLLLKLRAKNAIKKDKLAEQKEEAQKEHYKGVLCLKNI